MASPNTWERPRDRLAHFARMIVSRPRRLGSLKRKACRSLRLTFAEIANSAGALAEIANSAGALARFGHTVAFYSKLANTFAKTRHTVAIPSKPRRSVRDPGKPRRTVRDPSKPLLGSATLWPFPANPATPFAIPTNLCSFGHTRFRQTLARLRHNVAIPSKSRRASVGFRRRAADPGKPNRVPNPANKPITRGVYSV